MALPQIPLDGGLPQLAEVASEAVMRALFTAHLDPGWELQELRIMEARYRPGIECLLTYRLRCRRQSGEHAGLKLFGRAFVPGTAPAAFGRRPPLATKIGRLPSWLPQASLALWRFPDDPGIFGIADVWRKAAAVFDRPGVLDAIPWRGRRPQIEMVLDRYVPSKHCVIKYVFPERDSSSCFHGKVYGDTDAAVLYEQMLSLWQWSRTTAPELRLPKPLGCDRRLNVIWQTLPAGEPFLSQVGSTDLPTAMRKIAASLAALHRSPVPARRTLLLADERRRLEGARDIMTCFHPALARDTAKLLGALIESTPDEIHGPSPVHGDFHCNQVLLFEDHVAIQDLDHYSLGDPLLDVSRFLSKFRVYVRSRVPEREAIQAQEVFLSTYEMLTPGRIDRARLNWLMATLLVNRQLLRSVKKLSLVGSEEIAMLLATAKRMAQRDDWK